VEDEILDERAHFAVLRVLGLHRVHDHRAVIRQRARVIADDQRASLVGNVAEALGADAKVGLVQKVEQRLDLRRDLRIAPELVDHVRAIAHGQAAPALPHELERQAIALTGVLARARRQQPLAHPTSRAASRPRRAPSGARRTDDRSTGHIPTAASWSPSSRSRASGWTSIPRLRPARLRPRASRGPRRSTRPGATLFRARPYRRRRVGLDGARVLRLRVEARFGQRRRRRVVVFAGAKWIVAEDLLASHHTPPITGNPSPGPPTLVAEAAGSAQEVIDGRLHIIARCKAHHAPCFTTVGHAQERRKSRKLGGESKICVAHSAFESGYARKCGSGIGTLPMSARIVE